MAKRQSPGPPRSGETPEPRRPSRRKPPQQQTGQQPPEPAALPPESATPADLQAPASPSPEQGSAPVPEAAPPAKSSTAAATTPIQPADTVLPESDPLRRPFTPEIMDKTVIAIPLLNDLKAEAGARKKNPALSPKVYDLIIDLNLEYHQGRHGARNRAQELVDQVCADLGLPKGQQGTNKPKSKLSQQYLFVRLEGRAIEELVRRDGAQPAPAGWVGAPHTRRAIYRIWNDFEVQSLTVKSVSTVKADAARNAFAALGDGIIWAVMDSGIDGNHPHFAKHENLQLEAPIEHRDFTVLEESQSQPLVDGFGHGTHVAGIIAGEMTKADGEIIALVKHRDEKGEVLPETRTFPSISGMAPRCKLVSLKVLDDAGKGLASNLIAAIEHVQEINGNGRRIRIHGVNMSVGYNFEPEWFACGQSPLCVEVDRLVRSGVVVVVAAGNTGYGYTQTAFRGAVAAGMQLSINDPGNADLAITVGSTHREMPHIYGVSYFSSKGPTGDGRLKPDLVAPGEKIISCRSAGRPAAVNAPAAGEGSMAAPHDRAIAPAAAAATAEPAKGITAPARNPERAARATTAPAAPAKIIAQYREDSGTSMAAPHVSGVIAAFLSARREFLGQPEAVKQIFLATATDLHRDPAFQGKGLVDLMRAIQSV